MSTRMLIDARHSEETRVAIVRGNRVEEFDYESANKRQLKGNIYLAKITRVEPSLQAAFVEYGGNRHGFLAFSEIHPDYYQIPVEDREALLAEDRAEDQQDQSLADDGDPKGKAGAKPSDAKESVDDEPDDGGDDEKISDNIKSDDDENGTEDGDDSNGDGGEEEIVDSIRQRRRMRSLRRRYKIQEVIKKRQILLIQVVKEERGNKGAALTTYLSLAGRFCVLMPNSTHGGGISRKISNVKDRKKLRSIMDDMKIPDGMGCIIRTAGLNRTKTEIKRDLDYMLRLWSDIRDLTLKSIAPALTYEEGNLIKRAIRDLYDRDIDEVHVEGEEGYRTARDFMKLLMPSHARKVQNYTDKIPLFLRYQVEGQIDAMLDPEVTLKSGGYIVINPTEALIAIDVNSGRSTREHNIEETALKTNLEAASEVARQLRLRDLAGLIVIDFIDMEKRGNNRKLERRMKEALKGDRARIQVGRVSNFGLMEMSRQRLRPNLFEVSTESCPHCEGTGRIRTIESSALHALRAVEEEGIRSRISSLRLTVPGRIAIYILNNKRDALVEIHARYGLKVEVVVNDDLIAPNFELARLAGGSDTDTGAEVITLETARAERQAGGGSAASGETGGRRGRRRGGRRNNQGSDARASNTDTDGALDKSNDAPAAPDAKAGGDETADDKPRKRRRRGRRGGRRRSGARPEGSAEASTGAENTAATASGQNVDPAPKAVEAVQPEQGGPEKNGAKAGDKTDEKPKRKSARKSSAKKDDDAVTSDNATADTGDAGKKPVRKRAARKTTEPATSKTAKDKPVKAASAKKAVSEDAKASKPQARSPKSAKSVTSKEAAKKPGKVARPAEKEPAKADKPKKASPAKRATAPKETVGTGAEAGPPAKKKKGWWQRG